MINNEIFSEIQNIEEKADEIISSANKEIVRIRAEAKEKVSHYKISLENELNSLIEKKRKEFEDTQENLKKSLEQKYYKEEEKILKRKDEVFKKIKKMFLNEIFNSN